MNDVNLRVCQRPEQGALVLFQNLFKFC